MNSNVAPVARKRGRPKVYVTEEQIAEQRKRRLELQREYYRKHKYDPPADSDDEREFTIADTDDEIEYDLIHERKERKKACKSLCAYEGEL